MLKDDRGLVPVTSVIVASSGNPYLTPFSREGEALEKIVQLEIESENWRGVMVTKENKREVLLNLCTQWWLRSPLKQSL